MKEQIKLKPCRFCGGPPIASAFLDGVVMLNDRFPGRCAVNGGTSIDACVWCHECGAQGPSVDSGLIYKPEEAEEAIEEACHLWNQSDLRHINLYQAAESDGMNVWPKQSDQFQ
ncbi:Lar family restriction alleviation protein [Marinobacter salarius]|uniref:Lar family restriction alleviation protein n=1 Tax=Marinobacter salarius TaxID=1420917 RepID=UPI003D0FBA42